MPSDLTGVRSGFDAVRRYYARNRAIVESCDRVVAFVMWDRKGGTENTIRHAERLGVPVEVFLPAAPRAGAARRGRRSLYQSPSPYPHTGGART